AGGNLKRIDADGTGLQVLAPAAAGQRGSWGIRGVILFKPNGAAGIYQIPAVGGASTPVTSVDFKSGEVDHSVPQFLADCGRFLYRIERTRGSVGAPDSATLCVASLDGNVSGRIFNGHS